MQEKQLQFSKKEIQLIVESLLYCASPDIVHTQYGEDIQDMLNLIVKIRSFYQDVPVYNVSLAGFSFDEKYEYPQNNTKKLLLYFPELVTQTMGVANL